MTELHHLTKEWYDKLVKDLQNLKEVELPEILTRLKSAIEQWDLSENAEYEQAMEDKNMAEKKISEIDELLKNVKIIENATMDTIWYGNKVIIERDWNKETYEIVWTWEVDIFSNKISLHSPLWKAIREKKKWTTITVDSPKWEYQVKIIDIK